MRHMVDIFFSKSYKFNGFTRSVRQRRSRVGNVEAAG